MVSVCLRHLFYGANKFYLGLLMVARHYMIAKSPLMMQSRPYLSQFKGFFEKKIKKNCYLASSFLARLNVRMTGDLWKGGGESVRGVRLKAPVRFQTHCPLQV